MPILFLITVALSNLYSDGSITTNIGMHSESDFSRTVYVRAPVNISFIKYWGKRDEVLKLPTKDSFGVSLHEVFTETSISIIDGDKDEIVVFDDESNRQKTVKGIQNYLDLFRSLTGLSHCFRVETKNNFPTASGLASSSSGFSALATGLVKISNLDWPKNKISALARLGSGSAARSVSSGFVRFYRGEKEDGTDSFGETIFEKDHWPDFRLIAVITTKNPKYLSSKESSPILVKNPLFSMWSEASHKRVDLAIEAVRQKDLKQLGELMELDWYELQEVLATCTPPINYATEATHQVINQVRSLRNSGIECYFTTHAGPQVQIICLASDLEEIMAKLQELDGVIKLIASKAGSGAYENSIMIDENH